MYRLHFRNGVFYGENTGAILVPITNFKLPGNAAVGLEPRCGFSLFVSYSILERSAAVSVVSYVTT